MNGCLGSAVDDVAADEAAGAVELHAVAAGIQDLAVAEADVGGILELDEAAALRQRLAAAFEQQSCKRDVIGPTRRQQRGALREDEPGRTANTENLRAGWKLEISREINAGPEDQRDAGAGRLVDRTLQYLCLIVGPTRAHAQLGGVDAEARQGHGRGGRSKHHCARDGAGERGNGKQAAAVDGHEWAPVSEAPRFKLRAKAIVPARDTYLRLMPAGGGNDGAQDRLCGTVEVGHT